MTTDNYNKIFNEVVRIAYAHPFNWLFHDTRIKGKAEWSDDLFDLICDVACDLHIDIDTDEIDDIGADVISYLNKQEDYGATPQQILRADRKLVKLNLAKLSDERLIHDYGRGWVSPQFIGYDLVMKEYKKRGLIF